MMISSDQCCREVGLKYVAGLVPGDVGGQEEKLFVNILNRSTWLPHVSSSGMYVSSQYEAGVAESGCFSPFW